MIFPKIIANTKDLTNKISLKNTSHTENNFTNELVKNQIARPKTLIAMSKSPNELPGYERLLLQIREYYFSGNVIRSKNPNSGEYNVYIENIKSDNNMEYVHLVINGELQKLSDIIVKDNKGEDIRPVVRQIFYDTSEHLSQTIHSNQISPLQYHINLASFQKIVHTLRKDKPFLNQDHLIMTLHTMNITNGFSAINILKRLPNNDNLLTQFRNILHGLYVQDKGVEHQENLVKQRIVKKFFNYFENAFPYLNKNIFMTTIDAFLYSNNTKNPYLVKSLFESKDNNAIEAFRKTMTVIYENNDDVVKQYLEQISKQRYAEEKNPITGLKEQPTQKIYDILIDLMTELTPELTPKYPKATVLSLLNDILKNLEPVSSDFLKRLTANE